MRVLKKDLQEALKEANFKIKQLEEKLKVEESLSAKAINAEIDKTKSTLSRFKAAQDEIIQLKKDNTILYNKLNQSLPTRAVGYFKQLFVR